MRGRLQSGSDFDDNKSNLSRGFDDEYMSATSPGFKGSNMSGLNIDGVRAKRDKFQLNLV